jgi:hypothetical protein
MQLCFAILLIYLAGLLVFKLLSKYLPEIESLSVYLKLGVFWILGLGAISLELLWFSWLKIDWNIYFLDLPWLILTMFYLVTKRKEIICSILKFKKSFSGKPLLLMLKKIQKKIDLKNIVIVTILLAITFFLTHQTIKLPVWDWDGWAIWNFKAQVFYLKGGITLDFLRNPQLISNSHMDYPLLLPLAQVWIYEHLRLINTDISKIIFPITFFSLLCIFFGGLWQYSKKIILPIIFTTLLALTPNITNIFQSNYADPILLTTVLAAFILGFLAAKEKKNDFLFLCLILLGLCGWIKNEGQVIFFLGAISVALTILWQLNKELSKKLFIWLIFSCLIWLPWYLYVKHFHLSIDNWFGNLTVGFTLSHFSRIKELIYAFYDKINYQDDWGVAFLFFLFFALYNFILRTKNYFYYLIVIIWMFVYMSIYFFTPNNLDWQIETSLGRLMDHICPAAIFLIAITIIDIWKVKKYEKV